MKKNNKCKILSTLLAAPCCFWRKRDAIKNNLEGGGGGPNVPPNQMLLPIPCCFYMFYVVEEGFYAKKTQYGKWHRQKRRRDSETGTEIISLPTAKNDL